MSQPFSSANVSASASAAIEPVAKIAAAEGRPGRGSRLVSSSVATANSAASSSASAGERERALEAVDAIVERDQDRERRDHGGRGPDDRRLGARRAALREEARAGEQRREAEAEREMRAVEARAAARARPAVGPPGAISVRHWMSTAQSAITSAASAPATGTAATAASVRHAIAIVATTSSVKAVSARPSCWRASTSTAAANR